MLFYQGVFTKKTECLPLKCFCAKISTDFAEHHCGGFVPSSKETEQNMGDKMEIREATNADVASIAKLYTENWKETYKDLLPDEFLDHLNFEDSKQKWGSYLLEKGHKIFVAYEKEVFLGFSACKEDDEIQNCLYLDSLHVSKAAR